MKKNVYIVTINEMYEGIPKHTPCKLFDTQDEAQAFVTEEVLKCVSEDIEVQIDDPDFEEEARLTGIAYDPYHCSVESNGHKDLYKNGGYVDWCDDLCNYKYWYIDKVTI